MSLTDAQAFGDPGPAAYQPHTFQQQPDGRIIAVPLTDEQAFGPAPPGMPAALAAQPPPTDPIQALSQWNDRFQLGFDKGIRKPYDNLTHWMDQIPGVGGFLNAHVTGGDGMTGEQVRADHAQEVAQAQARGIQPSRTGEFLGNALGTAPLAVENPWLGGALAGAVSTDHPDDPTAIAMDAAAGAVGGGVTHGALGAVGHVIAPRLRPAVQTLVDNGVRLTPGQTLGGLARNAESVMDHAPVLGQLIKSARADSQRSFVSGAINNRVLAPVGAELPAGMTGHEAVNFAHTALSDAYERALPGVNVMADQPFQQRLADAIQQTNTLPQARQDQFMDILTKNVLPQFQGGALDGAAMQRVDSKLGQLGRQYGKSLDPDQRGLADAIDNLKEGVRDLVERQNPAFAPDLAAARQGWAHLVPIEEAAGNVGAKEGVFTGAQLASAITKASGRRTAGRGQAIMQDLSTAAQSVLPSTVGDSGTAGRGLVDAAILSGVGGGAEHFGVHVFNPATLGVAGALAAPYTKPGLALSRYLLAGQRPAWARATGDVINDAVRPLIAGPGGATAAMLAELLAPQSQQIGAQ